jgi:hypothetical protein
VTNVGRTSVRQFAILLLSGKLPDLHVRHKPRGVLFMSPLPAARTTCLRKAGSLRGIQGEETLRTLGDCRCCCSTNLSSTAEQHNPLRSVACQQQNACPLVKGDKVTNAGWTSVRQFVLQRHVNLRVRCALGVSSNQTINIFHQRTTRFADCSLANLTVLRNNQSSNTPTLQHSKTPKLQNSNTPILHYSIIPSLPVLPCLPVGRIAGRGPVPHFRD